MKRRDFIKVVGALAAAWPLTGRAQQNKRLRHVGVPVPLAKDNPEARDRVSAFEQGLQRAGWTVGQDVQIEYRFGGGNIEPSG
jgi:hypothetical protein